MTLSLGDRAFETSSTQGTVTLNLAGPVAGFRSFVAAVGSGKKVPYIIDDGVNWEVGYGTITSGTPDTLTRTNIRKSSNANAAVNWGPGTRNVRLGLPADYNVSRTENLNFLEGFGTIAGAVNVMTLTLDVAPLAYENGMYISGFINLTNTTAGVTINVNGLGAIPVKINGADPGIGNLPIGQLLQGVYKSATGFFELSSPVQPPALASQAEAEAGTENTKSMTALRVFQAIAKFFSLNVNRAFLGSGSTITSVGLTSVTLLTLGFTPKLGTKNIRVRAFGNAVSTAGTNTRFTTVIKANGTNIPGTSTDLLLVNTGYSGPHGAVAELSAPGAVTPISFTLVANTDTAGKTANALGYSIEIEEMIY